VAIAKWQGGYIAREAKLMVPSACSWLNVVANPPTSQTLKWASDFFFVA
jgi:hypothetical protein